MTTYSSAPFSLTVIAAPQPTSPPAGGLPAWVATIPVGQVREISNNTIASCWEGPQPASSGTITKAVDAYTGGVEAPALGPSGSKLFAGGGDADWWGTDAYAFDYATQKWARIKNRTTALSWNPVADKARPVGDPLRYDEMHAEHGDGTPGAPHTYDLVAYLPTDAGGGPSGSLLYPMTRFAYTQNSSNWAHKLTLDAPTWSRACTAPHDANLNLIGMSAYDPTTKRVWIVPSTTSGANVDHLSYLDFSAGTGLGVPGAASLGSSPMIYSGTMRVWGHYLVILRYGAIHLIDLANIAGGMKTVTLDNLPPKLGYPGSGFCIAGSKMYALCPRPDIDGASLYRITPPANPIIGTWAVETLPLTGVAFPQTVNVGIWKRFEYALGCLTWFYEAYGPVYAYRMV